jgi:GT2 family glycosyltransferase
VTTVSDRNSLPPINIIIPVFKNRELTTRCLESVLASQLPGGTTITVVDDDSPEPKISEYCRALADEGRVELLKNDENLGFVVSVNRGFSAQPDSDVLLLNSDTEVANDWLVRLRACAYRGEDIGTVTPFSNSATICSYPNFPDAGPLPELWNTVKLDQLFSSVNSGRHLPIPTAVGFCMFIKRRCLGQVGGFDEEKFGLGYGEECDFSLRAQAQGWQNVIAADVFVFHEGAASFSEDSAGRKEKADLLMEALHPQYNEMVTRFIQKDPLGEIREAVDAARLAQNPLDATHLLQECSQRQQSLKKHTVELNDVLLGERKARASLEKTLGKTLQQEAWLDKQMRSATEKSSWLDQELRKSTEKAQWLEKQLRESLEKSVWLQQRLDEQSGKIERQSVEIERQSQDIMQRAELALQQTAEIESLTDLLRHCREEFSQTDRALGQAQRSAAQLSDEVAKMKQSRSWRYTAWLRRVKGGL